LIKDNYVNSTAKDLEISNFTNLAVYHNNFVGVTPHVVADRAVELSQDLKKSTEFSKSPAEQALTVPADACFSGRGSARTGRDVAAELGLEEFQKMVDLLDAYGVDVTIDFEIVRGLEYYSGTVFEIYAQGLGAQKQICGGGTYELCSLFGGVETSSTGFECFHHSLSINRVPILFHYWHEPPQVG
jgi:histidyl-tRNA synthetase